MPPEFGTATPTLIPTPTPQITSTATLTSTPARTPFPTFEATWESSSFVPELPESVTGGHPDALRGDSWVDNRTLRLIHIYYPQDGQEIPRGGFTFVDVDIPSGQVIGTHETINWYAAVSPDDSQYVVELPSDDENHRTHSQVVDAQTDSVLFEIPFGYRDMHRQIRWSPDSSRIYIRTTKSIDIYDARNGTFIATLPHAHVNPYYSTIEVSADGRWIASYDTSGSSPAVVWDAQTFQIVYQHPSEYEFYGISSVIFSPNSAFLIIKEEPHLHLLNLSTMQIEQSLAPTDGSTPLTFEVHPPDWSPDSMWVFQRGYFEEAESARSVIFGWNTFTGANRVVMDFLPGIFDMGNYPYDGWHPTHNWNAEADTYGNIYVFSLESGGMAVLDSPFEWEPNFMEWSPDGHYLAAVGDDGLIQIWAFK